MIARSSIGVLIPRGLAAKRRHVRWITQASVTPRPGNKGHMTEIEAPPATPQHPFTAAIAARDVDALARTLAPEPILYSAVAQAPFEGREELVDLYTAVLGSFEELRIVDEFQSGDTHAFFWEGRIGGRYVAGADRLRLDDQGRVREITIVGRPLEGLSTFLTGIGYRFARKRRGPVVAALLRLTALPLGPLFSLLNPVSRWIARGRPRG
jgi:SnoaL-like domain